MGGRDTIAFKEERIGTDVLVVGAGAGLPNRPLKMRLKKPVRASVGAAPVSAGAG